MSSQADSQKRKLPNLYTPQPMVTVIITTVNPVEVDSDEPSNNTQNVPKTEQKFLIHKEYICHHSDFFKAAFASNFVEGQTQTICFDDIDPRVFGLLVHWIYYQEFDVPSSINNKGKQCSDLPALAHLWILAQRFLLPTLQNMIVERICDALGIIGHGMDFGKFMKIASEHDVDSELSKLAIRLIVLLSDQFLETYGPELPNGFALPVIHMMKKEKAASLGPFRRKDFHVKESSQTGEF